jgi:hypothetical protein
MEAEIWRR